MMEVKKSIVPQIMTILLVALMILMSEVFHEKEFIFPEITALTIGAWLAPKQVWKTNKIKLVFLIATYASLGIILVKYVDIDIYFKILIGFVVCVTGLFLSKTTFAPLISATILPIIINSESWLYPLFATAMSILIVIGQQYLEKGGYRSVQEYHPVTAAVKETYSLNLKRLCALALTAFIALQLKLPFLIAPPLIVAFVELSSNHPKLRHNSIKLAFVTFICAFSGAYGRILISEIGDFSAVIAYDFELSGNLKPHLPGHGQTAQGADVICHTSIGILDDVPVFVDDVFVVGIAHGIPFHIYGNNLTAVFPEYHFHYFVADVGAFFPIKAAVELDDFPTAAL